MSAQPVTQLEYRGTQPRSTEELSQWHACSPAPEILEPALPIVDAHHHLHGATGDKHYYRLADLQADIDSGHRVIGTVYVEAYSSGWRRTGPDALRPVGEVEMIAGLTSAPIQTARGACRVAAAIVGHADLMLGDGVAEVLEQEVAAGCGRLRGVRHRTATDDGLVGRLMQDRPQPHMLCDPAFRLGLSHLDRFGLSFDALVFHPQLGELIEIADAFPNTRIVVNHAGAPIGVAEYRTRRPEVMAHWEKCMRALAARPNVSMKIGGMGMTVFGFGFEHMARPATSSELVDAWQPLIDTCIEAFGTKRCMFQSNFPVDKQSCSYVELWNAFKVAAQSLSWDERSDLFYRTACRTYRLPELQRLGDESRISPISASSAPSHISGSHVRNRT